jgi:hypothetical protein
VIVFSVGLISFAIYTGSSSQVVGGAKDSRAGLAENEAPKMEPLLLLADHQLPQLLELLIIITEL